MKYTSDAELIEIGEYIFGSASKKKLWRINYFRNIDSDNIYAGYKFLGFYPIQFLNFILKRDVGLQWIVSFRLYSAFT